MSAPDIDFTRLRFVTPSRYRLWPQATRHSQWPGSGKPGDAAFDAFYATQFPSLADYRKQQEINGKAIVALLDRIGPAVLLVHSQSGAFAWPAADARPKLVKAIVAVEPNGPPVYDTAFMGAPEWFADVGPRKISGLGMVPLSYRPPLKRGEALSFVRQPEPDRAQFVRGWLQAGPARKLQNLAQVPVMILTAEASYHAAYDHCTVAYLSQAGVSCKFVRLADVGIHGNGHMMMLEKNSDEIAAVIEDWLKATLGGKRPVLTAGRVSKRTHKASRKTSTLSARLARSK